LQLKYTELETGAGDFSLGTTNMPFSHILI